MDAETLLTDTAAPAADPAAQVAAPDSKPDAAQAPAAQPAATTDAKPDDKPAVDATKDAAKPAEEKDEPKGAPEKYADFVAPDGITLDPELTGDLAAVAKELNLPQEAAQKIIDLGVKQMQKLEAAYEGHVQQQAQEWAEATKIDKELGGLKFAENLGVAKKAFDQFGTPELRQMLITTGVGNHPELIRAFHRIGKAISEDSFVSGGKTTGAKSFYDNSNMNP